MRIERQRARERLRPDVTVGAQMVSYDNSPFDAGDVKLGVKVSQPLFFRSGRGDAENAEAKIQALRFKEDLTQQKIRADVIGALVALRQLQRRVQAADRQVALARRLQQAERRRFNLGESTLFLVNQREDAFAKAREERVAARIDGLQAEARYRWATGTIGETAPAVPTP